MRIGLVRILVSLHLIGLTPLAFANVKLPAVFSDHAVLQQDASIPVWGWADSGEEVTISIAGQTKTTKAGADGLWKVSLEKITKGGPHTLEIKGKNTITIKDVLVGEVWLGSGQSNMAMTVNRCKDYEKEKAAANFPQIRMFKEGSSSSTKPQQTGSGSWVVCSPETVGGFSGTAYFFGRELHQNLKVPVGLINSSVGGTPVESWTSYEAQAAVSSLKPVLENWKKLEAEYEPAKAEAKYKEDLEKFQKAKAAGKAPARAPQKPTQPRENNHHPGNLFNGKINPLIPYAIRGAIWYQGENNAGRGIPNLYGDQLSTLINDWRARWGQGDFPFAWVQLPNFHKLQTEPVESTGWVTVREEMTKTLRLKNTGMAVTLDAGEANDIHPKDKQTVGHRLALWALATVYGQKIPHQGPTLAGHETKGNEIILQMKNTDGGLKAQGDSLKGFAIAGADKKWVFANARIDGNRIILSHASVKDPIHARYAWADNTVGNLFNGAGLPAGPFRTDKD